MMNRHCFAAAVLALVTLAAAAPAAAQPMDGPGLQNAYADSLVYTGPKGDRMASGSEALADRTGLAVSGGGFRATLFHLGSVWRLNELGYLLKLDRISSVSGGSVTTGLLAVKWRRLQWVNDVATNFQDEIGLLWLAGFESPPAMGDPRTYG